MGEAHHLDHEQDHEQGEKEERRALPHGVKKVTGAACDVTVSEMQSQHRRQQHFNGAEHPGKVKVVRREQPDPLPQPFRHLR
ncbi:MAG: hypothetical protein ACRDQH_15735 [Pseudonocardiaceae bacterium]